MDNARADLPSDSMMIRRIAVLFFYIGIALAATAFMPLRAIEPCARVLVLGISLMAAGLFPAMTVLVGSMEEKGRAPGIVENLYEQFHEIIKILIFAFVLAGLSLVFILITIALSHSDGAPHNPIFRQVTMCIAISLSILFADRSFWALRTFLHVLEIKKKQALLYSQMKTDKFFARAQENIKLSCSSHSDETKPLHKTGHPQKP
ncbi:MAG: hypothetical protein OXE98_03880 [Hyphomicrobiales bacterium]|nr:hypothetical protein [Hyphomicrobiales bacterium]